LPLLKFQPSYVGESETCCEVNVGLDQSLG